MTEIRSGQLAQGRGQGGEQPGSLVWLMVLALTLVGAAIALSVIGREAAEPYVLGLLALFSVIGVVALFALATGVMRVGERSAASVVSAEILGALTEGVVVTGPDERVLFANETYRLMSGSEGRAVSSTVPTAVTDSTSSRPHSPSSIGAKRSATMVKSFNAPPQGSFSG